MSDAWLAGDAYEAYMGRWSRVLARAFVEWLAPPPSADWLDVGCGTGALTAAIRELAAPRSIVACDPAAPFVAHARTQLDDERISFVVAGTDALPRRDDGFDAIASCLVLNFVAQPADALAAMRERARAGGFVAACVWDYREGMELLRWFWDEAIATDPEAAALDEGRRFALCDLAVLVALFRDAGFAHVHTGTLEIPTCFASFDDYWTPFLRGTGPAPSYVASLDPQRRDALRERLRRRIDARRQLTARAFVVRGE